MDLLKAPAVETAWDNPLHRDPAKSDEKPACRRREGRHYNHDLRVLANSGRVLKLEICHLP
jgi:hypothetical protein